MEFDNPLEVVQFPIEKDKIWGIAANTVTVSIDGSVESVWLRLLTIVNKFIKIVPDDIAKYLPNIDISQILNDRGIETTYTIDIPEIPADLMPYHSTTTPFMEALGSENIKTEAGSFDAAVISIIERNGEIYYSDDVGFLVKGIGHFSEYIPIVQDLNIELKSYTHQ
ncbi:MAG: hypothetical protein MUO82_07460 [Candidatus Thermoplasmatota archaeon]|nr:hypothetical protein [Candidatus Thermoplasmatota archaeon]